MKAHRIVVSGMVQGVGFRRAVWSLANRMGLRGYVRNLPDGSVEIVVAAARSQVDELVTKIRSLKLVRIDNVRVEEVEVAELPEGFEIR